MYRIVAQQQHTQTIAPLTWLCLIVVAAGLLLAWTVMRK